MADTTTTRLRWEERETGRRYRLALAGAERRRFDRAYREHLERIRRHGIDLVTPSHQLRVWYAARQFARAHLQPKEPVHAD